MDKGTGKGGPAVSAADGQTEEQEKTPEEIRQDIDQTREQLGDTVEALAAKADVKGQAKERVTEVRQTAQQKKDEFLAKAKQATPESASAGAQQVAATAQQRPVPFAAGGAFAAGVLVGWLLGRR